MLEWRRMNAIAKSSTVVLVLVAGLPFLAALAVAGTVSGCDKFKKGGDADAASDAAPVATTVDTAPTSTATPSATTNTPTWHPPVHVDGGAKHGDAGTVKLADGGVAPLPTPMPSFTPPPGFPTALPSTFPTAFPSNLPRGLPSGFPAPPPVTH